MQKFLKNYQTQKKKTPAKNDFEYSWDKIKTQIEFKFNLKLVIFVLTVSCDILNLNIIISTNSVWVYPSRNQQKKVNIFCVRVNCSKMDCDSVLIRFGEDDRSKSDL